MASCSISLTVLRAGAGVKNHDDLIHHCRLFKPHKHQGISLQDGLTDSHPVTCSDQSLEPIHLCSFRLRITDRSRKLVVCRIRFQFVNLGRSITRVQTMRQKRCTTTWGCQSAIDDTRKITELTVGTTELCNSVDEAVVKLRSPSQARLRVHRAAASRVRRGAIRRRRMQPLLMMRRPIHLPLRNHLVHVSQTLPFDVEIWLIDPTGCSFGQSRSLRDYLPEMHKCHRVFSEFEHVRMMSISSYGDLDLWVAQRRRWLDRYNDHYMLIETITTSVMYHMPPRYLTSLMALVTGAR